MLNTLLASSVLLWIVLLLNLVLTIGLIRRFNQVSTQMSSFPEAEEGLDPGTPAPDFQAETLTGEIVTLANYTRKAVSFIFFSPTCGPCLEKLPTLNALVSKAEKAGVQMVLVNTDGDKEEATALVQKHSLNLPILLAPFGDNPFAEDYKAMMTPFFCLLNPDGAVEVSGSFGTKWEKVTQAWGIA